MNQWVAKRAIHLIDFVSFSPDGKTLASGSEDGTIILWDVKSGKLQYTTFEGLGGDRNNSSLGYSVDGLMLVYSPDGKTFASSSRAVYYDSTIQLWDASTCEHKGILKNENSGSPIYSIAFSPDSLTVAGGDGYGTVYLWDVMTKELKYTFEKQSNNNVLGVAFSPNGRLLASGAVSYGDGEVRLWDITSGECKATLYTGWVSSVAFNPDGSILAVGGGNGVTLWDVHRILLQSRPHIKIGRTDDFDVTGRQKAVLKGHTDLVTSVVFSPNGHTLATGSKDGTILLWDITKTPTTEQIAQHGLSSTIEVALGNGILKRGQSNGFFIGHGLVATSTYLWALPAGCWTKLAGSWSPLAKKQFLKKGDTGYIRFNNDYHKYSVIAIDRQQNLAILEIVDFRHFVKPLSLSDYDKFQIGDTVYVSSYPNMFSQGIISSINTRQDRKYFQITATIPDGCNGSPVFNNKGQVIGVASKNIRIPSYSQHLNHNFVTPSSYLKELLSEVKESRIMRILKCEEAEKQDEEENSSEETRK